MNNSRQRCAGFPTVWKFPNGMESAMQEAEARRAEARRTGTGGGYAMAGSPRDFPYLRTLMRASEDGDFGPAIEKYREDAAPERSNQAPKEFWPSTSRFRSVLYKAGIQVGENAAIYLELI